MSVQKLPHLGCKDQVDNRSWLTICIYHGESGTEQLMLGVACLLPYDMVREDAV